MYHAATSLAISFLPFNIACGISPPKQAVEQSEAGYKTERTLDVLEKLAGNEGGGEARILKETRKNGDIFYGTWTLHLDTM